MDDDISWDLVNYFGSKAWKPNHSIKGYIGNQAIMITLLPMKQSLIIGTKTFRAKIISILPNQNKQYENKLGMEAQSFD